MRTSPTRQLALLVGSLVLWACGGGGGGGGTTTTCPTGQITCGDRCVDPMSDRAHCGADAACQGGAACGAGEVCTAGACATSCPQGQVVCGDVCVDPRTDRAHCGVDAACHGGSTCEAGQVCVAGACAASCPAGQVNCGDVCVDPQTDRAHCGVDAACHGGSSCGAGQVCAAGACATSCPPGQVICGDACIDPLTDRAHCGVDAACHGGSSCGAGQVCAAGACATSCPSGQVDCDGKCVDPSADRTYCGADTSCHVFTTCESGQVCDGGRCVTSCPAGELPCDGRCVDPETDPTYCGASSSCTDGHACGAGSFCDHGACWSPCPAGQALCGGSCVDPAANRAFCGASGLCAGAASGVACRADQLCSGSACVCPEGQTPCNGACRFGACNAPAPGFEWKASVPLTAPPHFVDPPAPAELVAHIVFDGTKMVDLTEHTHWTAVGTPGAVANAMWAPAQSASGPFSDAVYWKGDAASGDWLRKMTSLGADNATGAFTVCARYKPGAHPGLVPPNKIIIALGIPEESGTATGTKLGGWALMQMHDAACFHHYSVFSTNSLGEVVGGEWMKPVTSPLDNATLAKLEWVWQCGGFDGQGLGSLRDSATGQQTGQDQMPWGTNGSAVAPAAEFPSLLERPAIGAYADGSRPLYDGQVYEIIVSTEPATDANMRNIVARAAGGLERSELPALLTGVDGKLHVGSPATVDVQPDGSVIPEHEIVLGTHLPAGSDPVAQGQCWGVDASAEDWSNLYAGNGSLLNWTSSAGDRTVDLIWNGTGMYTLVQGRRSGGWTSLAASASGDRGFLAPGTRHTFQLCFATDRTMRLYLDGTQFGNTSVALDDASYVPATQDPASTFALEPATSHIHVWRVWGCAGADPAACP